jgi:SnoaL-like domain
VTEPADELDVRARLDIADVLVRYASGIDRRDWALFRSCFTDDCMADYGDIGVWHGADEITACWAPTTRPGFAPSVTTRQGRHQHVRAGDELNLAPTWTVTRRAYATVPGG